MRWKLHNECLFAPDRFFLFNKKYAERYCQNTPLFGTKTLINIPYRGPTETDP